MRTTLCRVADSTPALIALSQELNLEGQRVADVTALGSLLSLRELVVAANQVADAAPLASCLLLTKLDLSDNVLEAIPSGFRRLVMLKQLLVAGNRIPDLATFESLAPLPTLTEISIARNPACGLPHCEEHLIAHLRQLDCIDGQAITPQHRQTVVVQAAKRRLALLEEQLSEQSSSIVDVHEAQQGLLDACPNLSDGIERLIAQQPESPSPLPVPTAQPQPRPDTLPPRTEHTPPKQPSTEHIPPKQPTETVGSKSYLPVTLEGDAGGAAAASVPSLSQLSPRKFAVPGPRLQALPPAPVHMNGWTQEYTQHPANGSTLGSVPPAAAAKDGVGVGGSMAGHESHLKDLISKSRAILHAGDLPSSQRQQTVATGAPPPEIPCMRQVTEISGDPATGDENELRELVIELLVVAMSVFGKMAPPFCETWSWDDVGKVEAETVIKQLIHLLPQLSASSFTQPIHSSEDSRASDSTDAQVQPKTPQPRLALSAAYSTAAQAAPPQQQLSFADASPQPYQKPSCHPNPRVHPQGAVAGDVSGGARLQPTQGHDDERAGRHRYPENSAAVDAHRRELTAQDVLERAQAAATAADLELQAARLRAWQGMRDQSRVEISDRDHGMHERVPGHTQQQRAPYMTPTAFSPWHTPQPRASTDFAGGAGRGSAEVPEVHADGRVRSPLVREIEERFKEYQLAMHQDDVLVHIPRQVHEIEERFRQYQQTMRQYDSALQPSGLKHASLSPQPSVVAVHPHSTHSSIHANDLTDAAALFDVGTFTAAPAQEKKFTPPRAAIALAKDAFKLPPSDRYDKDSCHVPRKAKATAVGVKAGLEKGAKKVKPAVKPHRTHVPAAPIKRLSPLSFSPSPLTRGASNALASADHVVGI